MKFTKFSYHTKPKEYGIYELKFATKFKLAWTAFKINVKVNQRR